MQQSFEIGGMRCGGCVDRVRQALQDLAIDVGVTLEPPRAVLQVPAPLPLATVRAALSKAGRFEVRPL